jgi:hypothetical protein
VRTDTDPELAQCVCVCGCGVCEFRGGPTSRLPCPGCWCRPSPPAARSPRRASGLRVCAQQESHTVRAWTSLRTKACAGQRDIKACAGNATSFRLKGGTEGGMATQAARTLGLHVVEGLQRPVPVPELLVEHDAGPVPHPRVGAKVSQGRRQLRVGSSVRIQAVS